MFKTMNVSELMKINGGANVKGVPYYYGGSIVKWGYIPYDSPIKGYRYDTRSGRYEPYYCDYNGANGVARYFY